MTLLTISRDKPIRENASVFNSKFSSERTPPNTPTWKEKKKGGSAIYHINKQIFKIKQN